MESLFIIQKPLNFIFYIFLIYIKIKNIKWYIKYTLRDLTFCEFFTKLVMVRHVFQYVDNKLNITKQIFTWYCSSNKIVEFLHLDFVDVN